MQEGRLLVGIARFSFLDACLAHYCWLIRQLLVIRRNPKRRSGGSKHTIFRRARTQQCLLSGREESCRMTLGGPHSTAAVGGSKCHKGEERDKPCRDDHFMYQMQSCMVEASKE